MPEGFRFAAAVLVLLLLPARTLANTYPWRDSEGTARTLATALPPPAGATRMGVADGSFGAWLRGLPLLPDAAPVRHYNGRLKLRQDVHAAVVDLDVGERDLQQCADAVMRLFAEYRFSRGEGVAFHPSPGRPHALAWAGGPRAAFERYLRRVFAAAGTASLASELRVPARDVAPGDVLIQGGYPGHAVLVLDVAVDASGRRLALLGQSYMPAQQFHVLRNHADPALSPWFDLGALDTARGLATPEWRPFHRRDLRAFARPPSAP